MIWKWLREPAGVHSDLIESKEGKMIKYHYDIARLGLTV
jgi:hypothetical protein